MSDFVSLIIDQIQRRLMAIGFGEAQRERLQRYRPLVDQLIEGLVRTDFERAFVIHPPLRDTVLPVAEALYPAEANHFRLLFAGAFDASYIASMGRLCQIERQANVRSRARASIAFSLVREICLANRRRSLVSPRKFAEDIFIIERILTYDVNTAMTISQEIEANDARRRTATLDEAAAKLKIRIADLDDTISDAVEQFVATAAETGRTTDFIKEIVGKVASASVVVRERSLQTAAATEEMSANIADIGQRARQSLTITHQAVIDAGEMNEAVVRLREATGNIGKVVGMIADIAAQTNLLALNATIEAARAGAHGRGFAIVASEVKALATQTADATAQISTRIAAVDAALSQAAQAITGIASRAGAVEQASTEISTMVASHTGLLQGLGETIARISVVTGQAASAVTTIASAGVQTASHAEQGASGARQLDERISALQAEADEFARRLRAA